MTVASYQIAGSQVIVPQRVEGESKVPEQAKQAEERGRVVEGADDFIAGIGKASAEQAAILRRLADWAVSLQKERLVRLLTYHGKSGIMTLLPYLRADNAGLVTIWHDGLGGLSSSGGACSSGARRPPYHA